jgi:hypothetical protein
MRGLWAGRSRSLATLVLIACIACPLVELFDQWDHTLQTGNDTEYALVVIALCVGATYCFTQVILKSVAIGFVVKRVCGSFSQKSYFLLSWNFAVPFSDVTSPPPLFLRI